MRRGLCDAAPHVKKKGGSQIIDENTPQQQQTQQQPNRLAGISPEQMCGVLGGGTQQHEQEATTAQRD